MSRRALVAVLVVAACVGGGDEASRDEAGWHEAGAGIEPTLIRECADPCPGIQLKHVGVLGSPEDSVLLDWRSSLVAGDWFITAGNVPVRGVVPLYDFDGRQIRIVGQYGGGPGEFRGPRPVQGLDGSTWIFDVGNQRLAVLGPEGSVVDESPLHGGPNDAVPLGDRAVVVGFLVSDSLEMAEYGPRAGGGTSIPPPFHFVSAEGEILRSFGEWTRYPQPPTAAAIDDTAFLTEVPGRYRLERRDRDGRVTEVLECQVEWFVTRPEDEQNTVHSGVSAIRVRGDSVWVRLAEPARGHRGEQLSGRPSLASMDAFYDTRIEIIDLIGPRVVASQVFEFPSLTFLDGSDLLYSPRQGPEGYVVMDLWRASIEDRGS